MFSNTKWIGEVDSDEVLAEVEVSNVARFVMEANEEPKDIEENGCSCQNLVTW